MRFIAIYLLSCFIFGHLSAQSLSGVESVEYDAINNRYLASSDGTSIIAIAPNGALSYFGSGLVADYGMEVVGNTLFAIAGSRIKGYDLTSATVVMDLNIPTAQFLNGLASDGADRLWATDFNGYEIYEINIANLSTPSYAMVADQSDIGNTYKPNGIVHDPANNRVIFVNWGANAPIKAMDLATYTVNTLVENTSLGNIDGITSDSNGNWYVANWIPARITRYTNDFSASETITVAGINNPADICYATETDTLAIPGGNQVLFVEFDSNVVGLASPSLLPKMEVRYANGNPQMQFTLSKSQLVVIEVQDLSGKTIVLAVDSEYPAGNHTVLLESLGLQGGTYLCRIQCPEIGDLHRVVIR